MLLSEIVGRPTRRSIVPVAARWFVTLRAVLPSAASLDDGAVDVVGVHRLGLFVSPISAWARPTTTPTD